MDVQDTKFSREMGYSIFFAVMLASDRRSAALDPSDLLGGIYIACLERISKYWSELADVDQIAGEDCGVTEPRLFYWMQAFNPARHEGRAFPFVPTMEFSAATQEVWAEAHASAKARSETAPVLAPEDFLLAIAGCSRSELGAKLVVSGLDLERVKQTARKIRPRPG